MLKRILLFSLVNIAIIVMITIILRVLGLDSYLTAQGEINYQALMVFCLIWGMVGSLLSLALSKVTVKWMMGVKVIKPEQTSRADLRELVNTVHNIARAAGLSKMPEVGFYESPEVNAFATGPTKNNALVAVSTGLLSRMNKAELEGVLGHEIAHVSNGDMVTMTLIQGVVNAFVMFLSRVLARIFSVALSRDDEPSPAINFGLIILFEILFGFLGMIVVAYFSRIREYAADKGSARTVGSNKMIAALEALRNSVALVDKGHKELATLKIAGGKWTLLGLLATHPSLEDRIRRLRGA